MLLSHIIFSFIQHFIQTMNVQRKQMVLLYLQGYQKDFYGYQKHSISIRMICMKDEKKIGWYIFWNIILLFHKQNKNFLIKFMFSKKTTKNQEIFTVNLTLFSKCQIDGEDFINSCDLLKKHKLNRIHLLSVCHFYFILFCFQKKFLEYLTTYAISNSF